MPSARQSYAADVTYGTNNEFGFDYLRDNMKYTRDQMVQRGHAYAIVDEVDSILVDEARTPLIISGPVRRPLRRFTRSSTRSSRSSARATSSIDEKQRSATFTDQGIEKLEERLRADGLLKSRLALRHRERRAGAPRQLGAARPQDVPEGQGLHRPQRRSGDHRRVHRPHDAGPPLFGRPAPGAGGQGTRQDPGREPDARLDHLPELLPPLQEAGRHDRHGGHRGRGIRRHLRPRTSSPSRPMCR